MPPEPLAVMGFNEAMALKERVKLLTEMGGAAKAEGTWPTMDPTSAASEADAVPTVTTFLESFMYFPFVGTSEQPGPPKWLRRKVNLGREP